MVRFVIVVLSAALLGSAGSLRSAEPTPKQLEFFEKKIRPVLVEQCQKCHSADADKAGKLKGGLLVDSRNGLLKGGDSGPAIVPGKPKESLLLKSLHYDGDVQMPPSGKLSAAVIADVEAWIAMGAPDPRGGTVVQKQTGLSFEQGRQFWSYRPVTDPPIPQNGGSTEIDRFILEGLSAQKLTPVGPADRAVLIRRVTYDLTGLPPTPEQVDDFVRTTDPKAYEKLVDRLIASPEFGERWGRHWLDVARFAESLTLRGFILKDAWRYRDYVIDAFNKDVPFDRFLREQIAGDLLPTTDADARRRQLVATAFMVMGNTNLEEQDKKTLRMDFVDETLDVVTKGFLGQTVTCARCHDHKFDPIPTKDYYALAGIFRNTKTMEHSNVSNWISVPLPVEGKAAEELKAFESKVAALEARIKQAKAVASVKPPPAKGPVAVKDVPGIVVDDAMAKKVGEWKHSTFSATYIGEGYSHDMNESKGEKTLTFSPDLPATGVYEVRLAYSPGASRAKNVPVTVFGAFGEKEISVDMTLTPPIEGRFLSLGEYRFERKGQSFVIISNEDTKGHVTADAVVFIPRESADPAPKKEAATPPVPKKKDKPAAKAESDEVRALEEELKKLQAAGPKRPTALSLTEESTIEDARVHIRGLVSNQGEVAPRGVLRVATYGSAPEFPKNQSGRIQLADWMTSPDNPLTARVFVNRAWHWLFGAGIVRTTDNFGTTGELPSHPALLDHLAGRFVKEGWSVKKLVRSLVLTDAYRRSSTADPALTKADPENRLLGRMNRRRMAAEEIRDTLLVVAGNLSADRGGARYPANLSADYNHKPDVTVRSVYLPVFRNSLPEIFEVFDFADPSMVNGKRNTSTVAPQALYLMNNPFPIQQAKIAATRILAETHATAEARLNRVYRLTLGRSPTTAEQSAALRFLQAGKGDADTWGALIHVLFASADFRYVN